jgi:hypothetical protein
MNAAYSVERVTTFVIDRPHHGLELLSMCHSQWLDKKMAVFFPDGSDGKCSDFPLSGITVSCKWQGHFVVACGHKERWVLSNTKFSEIDLEFFGPEWQGCRVTICRD